MDSYLIYYLWFSVKIDKETHTVLVDEHIDDITIDDLQDQLPSHQPRYVIYSYKMIHDDRVSYPMCFIYLTPRDSQVIILSITNLALFWFINHS